MSAFNSNNKSNRGSSRGGGRGGHAAARRGRGGSLNSNYRAIGLDYNGEAAATTTTTSATATAIATAVAPPAFKPPRHQSQPRASPSAPSSSAKRAFQGGLGSSKLNNLQQASDGYSSSYNSDNNTFLRPVAFIKASSSLASTLPSPSIPVTAVPASPVDDSHPDRPPSPADEAALLAALHLQVADRPSEDPAHPLSPLKSIYSEAIQVQEHPSTVRSSTVQQSSPPSEALYFVDTTGDGNHASTSKEGLYPSPSAARPISQTVSVPKDDLDDPDSSVSDTEEVYQPTRKQSKSGSPEPSLPVGQSRSYAVIVDDPVADASQAVLLPQPLACTPDAVGMEVLRELTTTTRRNPSKLSRFAQKKKNRREARDRKKMRKRGQVVSSLLHEFESDTLHDSVIDSIAVQESGADGEVGDAIMSAGQKRAKHRYKGRSYARANDKDAALEDYLQNIQAFETDTDLADTLGFLKATKAEHLNADDLRDIAEMQAEADSFALDLDLAALLETPGFSSEVDDEDEGRSGHEQVAADHILSEESEESEESDTGPSDARMTVKIDGQSVSFSEDDRAASEDQDSSSEEIDDDYLDIDEDVTDGRGYTYQAGRSLSASQKKPKISTFNDSLVDFDDVDEYLQKQWLQDRAKKAVKRQERYLKRLEAQPTKANRKKAKRAGVAGFASSGSFVHESASKQDATPDLHRINRNIQSFIEDSTRAEIILPPMEKKFRYAIHMLAEAYSLKSKSRGTGPSRHNVLYRTMHTSVRTANTHKVQRYLSMTSTWDMRTTNSGKLQLKGQSRSTGAPRNAEGRLVGEGADRIAADNIGHRMLAKMGWAAGEQIGRGGGLEEPLSAVVKTNKAGLGSGFIRYNRGAADV